MAGDHKCPVCQATFTRPQHVARHMRSHTGDRPYKCQYCGDQFARSDLLARHINKCHANEKPLPNAIVGSRRKGAAAASRATTSKQACDQCVQSSLPCDGANPCSKCMSRKCRCTYVKFHRQTAPSGPGHHPPRSPSSSSSPLGPRLPSHLDEFILGPPPSVPSLGTFANSDAVFHTPFTFQPTTPYPSNGWTASDVPPAPVSVSLASDVDMAAKYRAQADLMRRAGPTMLSSSSPSLLPSMYSQPHGPASSHWYPAWGESGSYPPNMDDTKSFDTMSRTHSFASSEPSTFAPDVYTAGLIGSAYRPRRVSLDFSDSSSATSQSVPSSAASSNVHLPLPGEMYEPDTHGAHVLSHQRRSSVPSSLPPPFPGIGEHASESVAATIPVSSQPGHPPRPGEGGFSSAFGLMSIDDPNALPGLSAEGAPFFSNLGLGILPHSPNATPMPTRVTQQQPQPLVQSHAQVHLHTGRDRGVSLSALPTPRVSHGKESTEARELRDMWRTYMRSPLSGSGTVASEGPVSASQSQMPQSPSGQRRRVRVSSLPSVTPTVEKGHPWMHGVGAGAGGSSGRTGVHDDLKSYEAAVNARNTSLKLNLVPRRKGTGVGTAPSLSASSSMGQTDHGDQSGISRPSSSSSSSSLAQALRVPATHTYHPSPVPHATTQSHVLHTPMSLSGLVKPPPLHGVSISLPIPPSMSMSGLHAGPHGHSVAYGPASSSSSLPLEPSGSSSSRESSVTSDGSHGTGTGGSGSDSEAVLSASAGGERWSRPSFKRHPSQTLGPTNAKRALVERPGGAKSVRTGERCLRRGEVRMDEEGE